MAVYRIVLSRTAESVYKWLNKHELNLLRRIDSVLDSLGEDPFQGKPLKGVLRGDYSIRVGSYRIIYTINKKQLFVYVLDIGHRREIYR